MSDGFFIRQVAKKKMGEATGLNDDKNRSNNGALGEGVRERIPITHGIYLQAKIVSSRNIICVSHNFHSGQYLVHYEDGEMELYLSDGSHEKAESVGLFDGVIYASKSNIYIAWNKNGTLKIWKFSFNNSLLVPVRIIKDHLDPNVQVKIIAIEQTSSKRQRMFAAINNGILVFRLKDGQCISKMPDLHRRAITDLIFYQPFQVLITAATDGSIKLWDNSGNLRSVFVGHISAITCLSICQNGPLALSGSADGSIRLWDIDANEQVECIETGEAVSGISKKLGESDFYTHTAKSLSFWKLNNVYTIFTIIGSQAKILKATVNPLVPALSYYICDDACVRFVCPKSGNILCVMMSPEWKRITDAVCVPSRGKVFVLLRDGDILKCSIDQNPCSIEETWSTEHTGANSACTALCLIEYIHEETLEDGEFEDENELEDTEPSKKERDAVMLIGGCEDGTLIVYNLTEGNESGKVSYSVDAHRDKILALASSNELNQIASCSRDKSVRIWRAFPSVDNTLVPLFYILNYEPATHLVYGKSRLCIALQEPSTATYNVTVFKTTDSEPERIEHSLNDDHQDSIIALCSCPKLELFASVSTDGIIKVWNERNEIIRVIKLHSKPSGLCFCSEKGDLLVGIGGHVHRIPHEKYLPEALLQGMVLMHFKEQQNIPPTAVNEEVLASLSIDQKHRLQKARSSEMLLAKFVDTLPQDEIEERKEEEAERDLAVSILKKRDSDLERIQMGVPMKKQKPVASIEVREEAWKKYIDLYYKRKPIPAIGLDDYDDEDDDAYDETAYKPKVTRETFFPERGSTGFFSISTEVSDIKKMKTKLKKEKYDDKESCSANRKPERSVSIGSEAGLTPRETLRPLSAELVFDPYNYPSESDLRRILSAPAKIRVPKFVRDRKSMVKFLTPIDVPPASDFPHNLKTIRNINKKITADAEDERQKSFNENRRAMGMLPVAPDGYLPNSIIVALYKELEKKTPVEEKKEEEWRPKSLTQKQLEELEQHERKDKKKVQRPPVKQPELEQKRWSFFDQFNFSPTTSRTETDFDIETPPSTPPLSPVPAESVPDPSVKPKELKPLKPIEKFVTKPVVIKRPTPPPRDPTPPPPRPETPLPDFITQFKGQEWFERFYPNLEPKMIPRPWSIEGFLQILLGLLQRPLDYATKLHILAAILILYRQRPFTKEATIMAQESLLTVLDKSASEVSRDEVEERNRFIKLCLTLLMSFDLLDEKFIVELMAQYITADIDPRQHVIHIFHHDIGLQDPHDFLLRELDKFTTYGIFDSFMKKQDIKQQCKDWLDKWTGLVKEHITSLRGKIYRAKKGNVVRGTKSSNANVKGILKKDKVNKRTKEKDKNKVKEKDKEKTNEKKVSTMEFASNATDKKISFVSNEFIDDAAENVGPIDAINYFCEVEYEKELERAREASVAPTEDTVKSDRLRNSVVLLPKIDGYRSLARLGETHKSCCHPERETLLAYDMRLPNFMNSKKDNFSRGLLLHLPPLTLNPFPNIFDELLYEPFANSQLVTLRSAPKYYVPARSYVNNLQV